MRACLTFWLFWLLVTATTANAREVDVAYDGWSCIHYCCPKTGRWIEEWGVGLSVQRGLLIYRPLGNRNTKLVKANQYTVHVVPPGSSEERWARERDRYLIYIYPGVKAEARRRYVARQRAKIVAASLTELLRDAPA